MMVNKKFDRFKQWAGEKMGSEARTTTTDDFKALELEMNLRHDGMDRLHKSMSLYVKAMAKKSEGDEKHLPVGHLGATMAGHGRDFSPDSEYGHCLSSFGRAHEAIARRQESFVTNSTSLWLESLERSLAQMKEYQIARKRLETRRLAYDTSLAKMSKTKKEDFRVEEELRAQKAKYEESSEDVSRRMEDIKDAEIESIVDLTKFLEEELDYHERCRSILLDLRSDWASMSGRATKGSARGRPAGSPTYTERFAVAEPLPEQLPPRPAVAKLAKPESIVTTYHKDSNAVRPSKLEAAPIVTTTTRHNLHTPPNSAGFEPQRHHTFEVRSRDASPEQRDYHERRDYAVKAVHDSPVMIPNAFVHTPLRALARAETAPIEVRQSPFLPRSRGTSPPAVKSLFGVEPAREPALTDHYTGSVVGLIGGTTGPLKKGPPPPPPSRSKKPAPPPPMKRAAFSSPAVPQSPTFQQQQEFMVERRFQ